MILHEGFLTVIKKRKCEMVRVSDAVAFLVADPIRRVAILVSQKREPMVRPGNPRGRSVEVPAGRFDIAIGVRGLVRKEAREETGMRIKTGEITLLNRGVPIATSPGIITERMYLAYIERDLGRDLRRRKHSRTYGVKTEGERIKVRFVTFRKLEAMVFEDMKTMALVQAYLKEFKRKGGTVCR